MAEAREPFTVFIVDDDASIRDSLSLLLGLRGYRCAVFASAEDFLASAEGAGRGCVVTDLRLPGLDGLALQRELARRGSGLPVVIITGHGDIAAAREAFMGDAVDFLEKPFGDEAAVAAIERAFARERARAATEQAEVRRDAMWSALTERERTVAELVLQGLHNRDIAERLGISPRTVEVHKARVLSKVGARNLAELMRIATGSAT